MRTIDYDTQTDLIGAPDLERGRVQQCMWAPPEAYATIDNVTKFALADDDYEEVQLYVRYSDADIEAMNAEDPQAVTDAAICELYEMIGALNG